MLPYVFHPMAEADMPLVQRWLIEPHVAQWWHDPTTLEYVSGDLDHHDLAQFIVTLDDRPFAYLQCYQIGEWHDSFGPQPAGTRGGERVIAARADAHDSGFGFEHVAGAGEHQRDLLVGDDHHCLQPP